MMRREKVQPNHEMNVHMSICHLFYFIPVNLKYTFSELTPEDI